VIHFFSVLPVWGENRDRAGMSYSAGLDLGFSLQLLRGIQQPAAPPGRQVQRVMASPSRVENCRAAGHQTGVRVIGHQYGAVMEALCMQMHA